MFFRSLLKRRGSCVELMSYIFKYSKVLTGNAGGKKNLKQGHGMHAAHTVASKKVSEESEEKKRGLFC